MAELVRLERRHEDFAHRDTHVIVVSVEGLDDARKTQADYPHLVVLADEGRSLTDAAALIHKNATPGRDAATPTTILVDRTGTVRWLFRPDSVLTRLAPDDLLQAIDRNLPAAR